MNEFEANDCLLTLSFPSLFMFGSGIKRPCGVSEADTRHMLLQYDNRFAEARDFCLLPFNQKPTQLCQVLGMPFMPIPIE